MSPWSEHGNTHIPFSSCGVAVSNALHFRLRTSAPGASRWCLRAVLYRTMRPTTAALLAAATLLADLGAAARTTLCAASSAVSTSSTASLGGDPRCQPLETGVVYASEGAATCSCEYARLICERLADEGVAVGGTSTCEVRGPCARPPTTKNTAVDEAAQAEASLVKIKCLLPLCAEKCPGEVVAARRLTNDERADTATTLCAVCRRELGDGRVAPARAGGATTPTRAAEEARVRAVDPLWASWTYGWYGLWAAFVAVDAHVAAILALTTSYPYPAAYGSHPYPCEGCGDAPGIVVRPEVVHPQSAAGVTTYDDPYAHAPSQATQQTVSSTQTLSDLDANDAQTVTGSITDAPGHPVGSPPSAHSPPPAEPSLPKPPMCTVEAFSANLPDLLGGLLPCLAGAGPQCCNAVVAAVGPPSETETPALPDCMCNAQAYDAMTQLLADGVGVNLEGLLGMCNAQHASNVAYPGSTNGRCEEYDEARRDESLAAAAYPRVVDARVRETVLGDASGAATEVARRSSRGRAHGIVR